MKTSLYTVTIPLFIKALKNLSVILDKMVAESSSRKWDIEHLLTDRLAPDQFPFIRQIQIACSTAMRTTFGLAGHELPKIENTEKSVEELKTRISTTCTHLAGFKPEDINGNEGRMIEVYYLPGKYLTGFEYVTELALPNFYFHMTTAYSILRHNGVTVGKADYLGRLPLKEH